jgi:hypothetical protein
MVWNGVKKFSASVAPWINMETYEALDLLDFQQHVCSSITPLSLFN